MKRKIEKELLEILIASLIIFALSTIIHCPFIEPNYYSDIVSIWYREEIRSGGVPYFQVKFEYPQLAGLITYISVILGKDLSKYYILMSIHLLFFTIGSVFLTYKIIKLKNYEMNRIYRYFLLTPSMLIFLFYNYDILVVFFILLAIFFYFKEKFSLAGLSIGFGIISKLVPILLIPIFLLEIKGFRKKLSFLIPAIIIPFIANLLPAIYNYPVWFEMYKHHMEWGLENSWLVFLFVNPSSWNTAKLLSELLLIYGAFKVYIWREENIIEKCFAMLSVFLLTNYVYTPQMNLFLLPFFVFSDKNFYLFYPFELFNACIILFWFITPNPTQAFSTTQYFATTRSILLFIILLDRIGLLKTIINKLLRGKINVDF
ncbi:MAG: glycosyltransferase family 87 protein [Nitrososphaerota archaeon]